MAASIQKFVIILTWKLQNVCKVLSLSRWECGKPREKCGIQPEKQAWVLEFWTLSTGFSTCGKNRADIRWVKRFGCGKLLPPAKRRMLGVQRDDTTPCGAVRTAAQKFHGRKITILWRTPASYVILQDESSSPAALRHGKIAEWNTTAPSRKSHGVLR